MILPEEGCEGGLVRYTPTGEVGYITSFNDTYVFVRYGDENLAKATYPRDLEWI